MKHLSYALLLGVGLLLGWWIAPDTHAPRPPAQSVVVAGPQMPEQERVGEAAPPVPEPRVDAEVEQRLQAFESELRRLRDRIGELEEQVRSAPVEAAPTAAEPPQVGNQTSQADPTGSGRVQRLTAAGLPPATAEFIDARLQDYELQRLYLRDRAVREGWFGSTRYTEAVNELEGGDRDLRASLDESDYDRYLYATGQPNRLVVAAVMGESAGAAAGLQANDVIYRYAGERVFNTGELRELTAAGSAGESVSVEVLRGQDLLLFYLPRGPIGVRLNLDRVQP